jgi:7,8-dihydropterin-6-yl-methyl-4-(beta-D-ribofuranosyl)aminobenzene 5'-phosphate synthase
MINMRILGIVDNYKKSDEYKADWGFSIAISTDHYNIIFDTGNDPEILKYNMNKLILDNKNRNIDLLFISHNHRDHTGGIEYISNNFYLKNIAVPYDIDRNIFKTISSLDNTRLMDIKSPTTLDMNIHTTGIMGDEIKEQSLVIETKKGLILFVGCSHPGISKIIEKVQSTFNDKIYLLLGGFHFYKLYEEKLQKEIDYLKKSNIDYIAPTHCTGDRAKNILKRDLAERFVEFGVGYKINI